MDKKLLNALNNLSLALEEIAAVMKEGKEGKPKTATSEALTSGNLDRRIEMIDKGVKQLQEDNKTIIKNQETIIALSKRRSDKTAFESSAEPDQKKKIKDGLGLILMIAVGVLAIGLAFKIIGKVDVLSVIALSIAIPLIAYSFERLSKLKIDLKQALMISALLPMMSVGLVLSSYILSKIAVVKPTQLLTAIGLGLAFVFIAPAITAMIKGLMSPTTLKIGSYTKTSQTIPTMTLLKGLLFVPLVMIAASLGIVASSKILQGVSTVSPMQLLTAIGISIAFYFIGSAISMVIQSLTGPSSEETVGGKKAKKGGLSKGALLAGIVIIPLVMLAMSLVIVQASKILQGVVPLGITQALTAIFIAGVFAVLGYTLGSVINGFQGVTPATAAVAAVMIPLIYLALSYTITLASQMFQSIVPINFTQFLTAVGISLIFVVLSYSVSPLMQSLKGVTWKQVSMGLIILIGLIAAVVVASNIMQLYQPVPFMSMLNMVFFSVAATISVVVLALGIFLVNKLGTPADYLKGGISILIIAGVITVTSLILSIGDFQNYPGFMWTLGTVASIGIFAILALLVGTLLANPLFYMGLGVILILSTTIMLSSVILGLGNYQKYPPMEWVGSTLLVLGSFALAMLPLGLFLPLILAGAISLAAIVLAIMGIDYAFQSGVFQKYPSKAWVEGSTFAILEMNKLMSELSFLGTLKDFAAGLFGGGINGTAQSILELDRIFSQGDFTKYPSVEYMTGIHNAISKFIEIQKLVDSQLGFFEAGRSSTKMKSIADGFMTMANSLSTVAASLNNIDLNKLDALKTLSGSIVLLSLMDPNQFQLVMDSLEKKGEVLGRVINQLSDSGALGKLEGAMGVEMKKGEGEGGLNTKQITEIVGQFDARLVKLNESMDIIANFLNKVESKQISLK